MAGTLYIVATPIGNLDDMPPRVAATFGAAHRASAPGQMDVFDLDAVLRALDHAVGD